MGVIYGITWYTMSLAMPCIFSLNSVIKNTLERKPSDRQRADTLFWLKYWVVFAYYYVLESVFDTIIAWLPLYNEVGFGLRFWVTEKSIGNAIIFLVEIVGAINGVTNNSVCGSSSIRWCFIGGSRYQ